MNFGISKKIILYTFQHKLYRFLSIQQNIVKCSSVNCSNKIYHKNINQFPCLHFSQQLSQTILSNTSTLINVQRRNASDGISNVKSSNKLPTDLLPAEEAVNLPVPIVPNIFKEISEWKIVELAQQTLLKVHEITGLPWWASIAFTAFIARTTVTLPFTLIQIQTAAKMEIIRSEIDVIAKKFKMEANYRYKQGYPEHLIKQDLKRKINKEMKDLIVRDNCHPAKCYILILMQFPLWISFSFAIRNLCYMLPHQDFMSRITYLEMSVGGFSWITNLVHPDEYMILPIILGLLNLTVLEVHHLFRSRTPTKFEKWIKIFLQIISIVTIPIAAYLPTAINLYWISSGSYGLMQAFLINSTRLRRFFKIPIVKSELKHPYQHFYNNFKAKLTYK